MRSPAILFSLLILSISILTSCNKDDDDSLSPCEGISCVNGGECVNGICDCPEGYTGPDCGDQQTPSSILITEIRCTSFPATDAGTGWDLTSAADIYITLERNNNVFYESGYFQNANASLDYIFVPSTNLLMNAPLETYIIRLYDFDTLDVDDYMGGISFTPYSTTNGFPETRTVSFGQLTFEFDFTYIY